MTEMTEAQAVRALKRLASRWPKTLWLWSASGTLWIMRTADDGYAVLNGPGPGSVDPSYCVDSVDILNDGGDW